MKKLIALLLALTMVLSMAACGAKNDDSSTKPQGSQPQGSVPQGNADVTPKVDADSLGGKLWNAFKAADLSASAEDVANALVTSDFIPFMGFAMTVEEGTLMGFDSYEVKGFAEGAAFAPGIGSIPFIGYIFKLADGADVSAFINKLTSNCNPRWNVCTEADQTVAGSIGNTVLFVMCPASFEDEGGDQGDDFGEPETIRPTVEAGTFGEQLWDAFLLNATGMVGEKAVSVAFWLVQEPCVADMMMDSVEVEQGLLTGFDNYEVKGFTDAAMFAPMIGSIPFVAYIFNLPQDADVQGFMNELSANCNRRWNICTEADQTVVGAYGNMVFFAMCPAA